MASSYSTDLKLELMVTGENSGTWGDKTNTNLNLVQQAIAGFEELSLAGGAQTTQLPITQETLSVGRNAVIKFTGAITGNQIVQLAAGIEKTYIIENGTTGAYTVEIEQTGGAGVTFAATDKGFKQIYSNGTNIVEVVMGGLPGGSNTQVQFNSSGAFAGSSNLTFDGTDTTMASAKVSDLTATRVVTAGTAGALEGDADLIWTAGTGLIINSQKELRLSDSDDSAYVGLKSHATVSTSYTLTMPAATGTADQILVTDGSGNLSFADNSGGTSWVAVKTANYTASAGEGVFCNTTGGSFTLTLPSSPTQGDEVSFVDYAGTFDTYALTIGRNSQPIQGAASDLTVSIERAANTLVYVDGTQGWLLKTK